MLGRRRYTRMCCKCGSPSPTRAADVVSPRRKAPAVAATLEAALERVAGGHDALGVLRRGKTNVGMGLLVNTDAELQRHWRTLLRVMVHPDLQGIGAGRLLLTGLHDMARRLGLEHLQLTARWRGA